jgi:hypothetical protein
MNSTRSSDAFVYDVETGQYWNILDDIERLPKLDRDIAQKSYVSDTMAVRLIRGFGSSRDAAAVLSLFSHSRFDLRAAALSARVPSAVYGRHPGPGSRRALQHANLARASYSENLLDGVNRPLRTDLPDAHGE